MKTYTISVPCTDSLTFNVDAENAGDALQRLKAAPDCMVYHRKTYDGQLEMDAAEVIDEAEAAA